jgi:hypothetical protein
MRVIKSLLSFVFLLGTAAVVGGTLVLYLAVRRENAPALREVASRFGRVIAGQHTEQMEVEVRVRPGDENLAATARLTVRAEADGRRHLYFLLNDGLRVQRVWQERANGRQLPLSHYRLWLLTVVALPRPLAKGEAATIGILYAGDPRRGGIDPAGAVLRRDAVLLEPEQLWYPADLQGFFQVDAEVTYPADLRLLHNGREVKRVRQGESERIRFTVERPVGGLALVAGRFHRAGGEESDNHRVLLAEGVDLDGGRVAAALAASDRFLSGLYGPSGFPRLTLFVDRDLPRGFFDGTGLIGIPPRQFRCGDYGFASIAHEVAHAWWGGTVGERWLDAGSGGRFVVDGFAELSSWLAVRDRLGDEALLRLLSERQYDPRRGGVLEALSAFDDLLDPAARESLRDKGGYVALMLRQRLGAGVFDSAARQLIERFRYKSATDRDLESVFGEVAKTDLDDFFAAWVRSDRELDLSLDAQDGEAAVHNYGKAPAPAQIDLWRFPPGGEPERQTSANGATTPVGNVERLVLDPEALTADMYRANNQMPRHDDPRAVARSARGDLMVVYGQPHPWSPATVVQMDARGERKNTWEFDQGLLSVPEWSADGTRILAAERRSARGRPQLVALSATDGSRERVSYDAAGSGAGNGTYVVRGPRLVRVAKGEKDLVLVEHPGRRIGSPLASPDGSRVAYAVHGVDRMDLRAIDSDGAHDRLLLTWNPGPLSWRWSPDGARLFAVLPGDWDWQLWEIPLDGDAPRDLVREAAGISDLAVAPDGGRVAVVAEPSLDYGRHRGEVFVIEPSSGDAQRFNLSGDDARSVAWLDGDSLLVVVADSTFPVLPEHRTLRRLRFSDGSLLPFP